jgi:hypothetical protein
MNALSLKETYDQANVMDEADIIASLQAEPALPLWKTMSKDEYRQYQFTEQCRQLAANLAAEAAKVFTPAPAPQMLTLVQMPMQQQRGGLLFKK